MKGCSRPKIRRSWGPLKPYTKVEENTKKYDRKRDKKVDYDFSKNIDEHEQPFLKG
jgi:hypothetical protein